jgi:predicted helicase
VTNLYFQDFWNDERYQQGRFFPMPDSENLAFSASGVGAERPFAVLASKEIPVDMNHYCPVKSRRESVGYNHQLVNLYSPFAEVPVK